MKSKLCLLLLWCQSACAATSLLQVTLEFENTNGQSWGTHHVEEGFSITVSGYPGTDPSNYYYFYRNPQKSGLLNANGLNTVPYNGTTSLVPFTNTKIELRSQDSAIFALLSLDVAEYSATPNLITYLRLTGYRMDGSSLSRVVNINRPVLGQASDFQTLTFDQNWSDLARVTMEASDSLSFRFFNGFTLDNVVLGVVPEPGVAWLLLAAPLLGLRRRRS